MVDGRHVGGGCGEGEEGQKRKEENGEELALKGENGADNSHL
jgi:hypothetical protein